MLIGDPQRPIQLSGGNGSSWRQGAYEVWHVEFPNIRQGSVSIRGKEAVLWIDRQDPAAGRMTQVIVYVEGTSRIQDGSHRDRPLPIANSPNRSWMVRLHSSAGIAVQVNQMPPPQPPPAIVGRAKMFRQRTTNRVQPAQFVGPPERAPSLSAEWPVQWSAE